jgi:ribosomal-protein-alanine acetyltransferase
MPSKAEDRANPPPQGKDALGTGCIFRASRATDEPSVRIIFEQANLAVHFASDAESQPTASVGSRGLYVCEYSGRIVGAIHWRCLDGEAEILDIAVAAHCRRLGHGSFLLANFLKEARRQNVSNVFLEVRESNIAAITFYQKFGFSVSGRRPKYYRQPDEAALLLHAEITG